MIIIITIGIVIITTTTYSSLQNAIHTKTIIIIIIPASSALPLSASSSSPSLTSPWSFRHQSIYNLSNNTAIKESLTASSTEVMRPASTCTREGVNATKDASTGNGGSVRPHSACVGNDDVVIVRYNIYHHHHHHHHRFMFRYRHHHH